MKEALKLALEALEGVLDNSPKVLDASISGGLYEVVQCRDAIAAIKEALAQPKPLTVDCIGLALDLEKQSTQVESQTVERAMKAAAHGLRLIEAALKEKNT